jgi:catechol 2,3-dioxygenase-like lactoylglutathione lyase family enzyme
MPDTTLVHVGVAASDLARSLLFWRDALGLAVLESRDGIAVLSDGAHNFTVFQYRGDRLPQPTGRESLLHIGVRVADLAAVLSRCIDLGFSIVCDDVDDCHPYDPANPPMKSFKVEDPDGIVVDVTASADQWLGVTVGRSTDS